jgi:4-amino-4-deoxy-L-arabinose transferase-like glycosyltransferase
MLKPQPTGHSDASAVLRSNANVTCRHDLPLGLVIFSLLSLAYLLTFSGEFNSIDELAIYAMTESLVQTRQLDTPQIVFAPYHNPVGVIEPVQSLMAAPLYALAQQFKQVNNIHAVLLSNVFITALTGMVLFLLLRRTGYSVAIACVTALSFGLATTAWPYARTLFREPLVGLLWITAALCRVAWRQSGRTAWLISSLALLGLGIATKIAAIIAVPIFVILIAADLADQRADASL